MSILLPLYVYPVPGAWDPLYAAYTYTSHHFQKLITNNFCRAKAYPNVEFTAIINPCSGPCNSSLPAQVYVNEIPKLKTFDNIRTLGYVATNYTSKELSHVLAEIDVYANWPKVSNNTRLKVDGIFFDETPSEYAVDQYQYLKVASQAVKTGPRFKDRFVGTYPLTSPDVNDPIMTSSLTIYAVHNPGLIAPSILNSTTALQNSYLNLADITVVFEEKFDKWLDASTFDALQDSKVKRSKLAIILHSMPNISKKVLDYVVEQVEETADWLFLTDVKVKDEYYHSFSPLFAEVVKSVDGV
jgi:hypothetical protein